MPNNYSVKYIFEAIDNMSRNLNNIDKNLQRMGTRFDKTASKVPRFNAAMTKASKGLKSFASKTKYMSIALTAMGTASVYAYAKFEKGLMNTLTLMNKSEVERYSKQLSMLQTKAIKAGFAIDDTNKALFDTVSALGATDQAMNAFGVAQKLAIGGVTDVGIAVDGLTSVVNAYGRSTTKASDVANAFYTAQQKGKTTVGLLASNVGKVAPIAKAAGVGFKELLSVMSALTLGGLSTDEATTALRGTLSSLVKPPKEATKILKALGISHGVVAIKSVGLKKVLEQVIEANRKYPQALAMAIPNIRAFTGLMSLTADKLAIVDDAMKQINLDIKNNTGLTEAYNKQQATMDMQLKRLKGSALVASSMLGEALAPSLKVVIDYLQKGIKWFSSLDMKSKKTIAVVGVLVAILSPLALILGTIAGVAAFVGAKILLIGGAIAAVVTAIVAAYTYFGGFINLLKSIWQWTSKVLFAMSPLGAALGLAANIGGKVIDYVFGGDEAKPVKPNPVNVNSSADINMNINAPKGVVQSVSSESKDASFNLGMNMTPEGSF